MKIKKFTFLRFVQISLIFVLTMFLNGCGGDGNSCCMEKGGINLDFSSLPAGPLPAVFTVDKVTGIRIYDEIKRIDTSLWCLGRIETNPGNWKDAAVMLFFCKLPCNVCVIAAEVHGHGNEARLVAAQQDGTSLAAVCPGDKKVLTLNATKNNPFIYAILSGQEAEWISFKLE